MSFYRHTALALAAATLAAGVPAMAQDMQTSSTKSSSVTRSTIPGKVSKNHKRVVHIKKHVIVPAKDAPAPAGDGATVHTTKTTTMHKSSAASSGPAQ